VTQDHVIMASYSGFITRSNDERIVLEWLRGDARAGGSA
jgi:hypothetical protein